jgi:hypothetical protein
VQLVDFKRERQLEAVEALLPLGGELGTLLLQLELNVSGGGVARGELKGELAVQGGKLLVLKLSKFKFLL